jgi:Tol biopolymer transport system component
MLARAFALALAATFFVTSCQVLNRAPAATEGAQGRIVWPKDADLWVYDLDARQQRKITNLPNSAAITGAAWSPDGKRIVYSQFWRRPNENASGADLFVSNADGSNPQIFASRDAANSVVETPQWAPSGVVYFAMRHIQSGRESRQIMRKIEGGQAEVVVDGAYSPSISADESTLVYLKDTRAGQMLVKKNLARSGNEDCTLIADQVFQYLSQPRISPDGTRVALAGSGEPNAQPSTCGGDNRAKPAAAPVPLDLTAFLQPAVAEAHGLPADMYMLNLDGSNLTRVADIKDDDPTVTWSPDGSRLGIFGLAALFVVDSKGGQVTKLVDQGGYGGLDWTR